MSRTHTADEAQTEGRLTRVLVVLGIAVGAFLLFAIVSSLAQSSDASPFDPALPNPMGGPARAAPGESTGQTELGALRIEGAEVAMGDVGLGITYVPAWDVTNPTADDVTLVVGQPQVLEGCCPGPVYADGELTQAGQELTVPAGGDLRLQFPLQMHPGMDGPHHLAIPLLSGEDQTAVHVTGNFTADA